MASPRRPPPEPPHRARHHSPNTVAPPAQPTASPKRTLPKDADVEARVDAVSPPKRIASPQAAAPARVISPPTKAISPPAVKVDSKSDDAVSAVALKSCRREQTGRDVPFRAEKLSLVAAEADGPNESADLPPPEPTEAAKEVPARGEESNGVGDKIKIFEKVAEDAATAGRVSRGGSVRRRAERLPSDELPPPPPPAESQRLVRPEFRPLVSPAEVTIRSPSLGAKAPERFPSHGTAFRNVSAAPPRDAPDDADAFKTCKFRGRERPAPARAGYFTRGSEEIWLVKKKDIEEIEERVLDSFRRAGAGRGRRGYGRSESLEARGAEWAARAHTLKRQASVACTCGHDKKQRARPAAAAADAAPRVRSRSHGDSAPPAPAGDVLDKYETLV